MEGQLEVSPEFAALLDRLKGLKVELAKLVSDRDHLLTVVKPHLETKYYTTIGIKQHELLLIRNETLRMRRRIELIRAYLNRGESPDLEEIEIQLGVELQRWLERVQNLLEKIRRAEFIEQLPRLSPQESEKLKQLYRKLVRRLHPDINEDLPENFKYLWNRVQAAYRMGDLEELETLVLLLEEQDTQTASTMEQLRADIERLTERIHKLLKELAEMKERFPFSHQEQLADDNWIKQQEEALQDEIEQHQAKRELYADILADLLKGGDE